MPRPLLLPRYVQVPAAMVYDEMIPETVRFTYVMLRGLAWGSLETPAVSMDQLTEVTGKKQSAIYKHMAFLRDRGALLWRPAGHGTIIVSFPDNLDDSSTSIECGVDEINSKGLGFSQSPENNSINMEKPFIKLNQESKLNEEVIKNTPFHVSGKHPMDVEYAKHTPRNGTKSLSLYKSLTNLTPNRTQRRQILDQVTDLDLWRSTLEHWLTHGWNPRNVQGILNLYTQGGPDFCRFCHPKKADSKPPILDHTAQRERDRIEARKIIEEARARKATRENSLPQEQS